MRREERVKIVISGKVQGVFFRKSLQNVASKLKLRGWVHNLPDGNVGALAEGERAALEKLIEWCHTGPPGAFVVDVACKWSCALSEYQGFRIVHT